MFFAFFDYLNYRCRKGRYSNDTSKNFMALGHKGGLPEDIFQEIEPGDTILVQNLKSFLSWGTMYFTNCTATHTAIYAGSGRIAHMTLKGFRNHPISILFDKDMNILPFRQRNRRSQEEIIQMLESAQRKNEALSSPKHRFFENTRKTYAWYREMLGFSRKITLIYMILEGGWKSIPGEFIEAIFGQRVKTYLEFIVAAILLMTGYWFKRFRWRHLADMALVIILLDTITYLASGVMVFVYFLFILLFFFIINSIRYLLSSAGGLLKHYCWDGNGLLLPDRQIFELATHGGIVFSNKGPFCMKQESFHVLSTFPLFGNLISCCQGTNNCTKN